MATLLSIGDFSRMTHLSVKALRHYHDVGVLAPAAIDPFSGYRSYDTGQVATAQVIRRLRDLGMPLEGIRSVLAAPDVSSRNAAIAAHLSRMERELAETQASVASLRALLTGPAERTPVTLRSLPAVTALGIREVVSAADAGEWAGGAFTAIAAALEASGRAAAGCYAGLFPGDYFEVERAEVTLFVPVGEAGSGPAASGPAAGGPGDGAGGRVQLMRIPEADVAVAVHEGGSEDIDRTYGALGTVVAEQAIGVDGPIREYFLVGFLDAVDEAQHRTEVCWPVFRTVPA